MNAGTRGSGSVEPPRAGTMWRRGIAVAIAGVASGCVLGVKGEPEHSATQRPPPRDEQPGPKPPQCRESAANCRYSPGYYHWTPRGYVWIDGHWESTPP
ncbi:MAG TPA: hypothetical protein VFQ61_25375 [Polyangiaceae bacterium]|nr:hypothetical protein [Polyangiaceae bacterium]